MKIGPLEKPARAMDNKASEELNKILKDMDSRLKVKLWLTSETTEQMHFLEKSKKKEERI